MKKSLFLVAALVVLAACARNQEIDIPNANLTLIATTEAPADTKTIVEGGIHVYWEPGDEISVFNGEKSAKFVSELTASSATATFKGTFGDDTWPEDIELWAVYPFSEDAVFDGETITTTLPSEQVARAGSFGKDMNLAVANSFGTTLQFYNVGGGIRFSVTEEGIKKVMFEGLNGEIISGKVKIGLDENGLPKVQEVTSGSQFITLLPPEGQTAFQKDTWYYIVAIPGSLRKGYKMRFYKDADYARKESENAVQIKRSIYGSIDKADEGIEFETQTMHFPETDDEIVASVEMTQSIHKDVYSILWKDENSTDKEIKNLVNEIRKIDGVIFVQENEDKTAISVIQKDSICVNYMLKGSYSDLDLSFPNEGEGSVMSQRKVSSIYKIAQNLKEGKKALILAPFQWDFNSNIEEVWVPTLSQIYANRIKYLPDTDAGILQFKEELLEQYDLIIIDTHGTTGFSLHPVNVLGGYTEAPGWDSYLSTSTQYSADVLKQLVKNGDIQIRQTGIISPPESSAEYLGVSVELLDDASFDDSCVMIFACESAKTLNKGRPWLDTFTSKGALVVSGATVSMSSSVLGATADKLIEMMTLGCSFRDAFSYVTKSSIMTHWSNAVFEHFMESEGDDYGAYDIFHNYVYKQNESKPMQDYFLTNPSAQLNNPEIGSDSVVFSWESYSIHFPYELSWYYSIKLSTNRASFTSVIYDRTFDVYIDGQPIGRSYFDSNDNTKQTVTYPRLSEGPHTWKVITNIIEKESGIVIGSYASADGDFTIEDDKYEIPDLIDLGLPSGVKWASFNLGASRPEGFGKYFAWGETEAKSKSSYNWDNYKWCKGTRNTLTKYCWDSEYGYNGFTDNKHQIELEDDAAHVQLGGSFRTPTSKDWRELMENTTWTWTSDYNGTGVAGYIVRSTVSGYTSRSIFLPIAGYPWYPNVGAGRYMTSTALFTQPGAYNEVYFTEERVNGLNNNYVSTGTYEDGSSIRPVYGPYTTAIASVSPTVHSFGKVLIGESSEVEVIISNTGDADMTVTGLYFLNGDRGFSGYTLVNQGSIDVKAGMWTRYYINFTPTARGEATDTYIIETSVGTLSVKLTGTGITDQDLYPKPTAVDLGLSVSWASFNLGASKPEEQGIIVQWGAIQPRTYEPYTSVVDGQYQISKYNTLSEYGPVDNLVTLKSEDDAARYYLGGSWRTPTYNEIDELIEKCEMTFTEDYNGTGVSGCIVRSNVPGYTSKYIFIPVTAGYSCGKLWSSSLDTASPVQAFCFYTCSQQYSGGIYHEYRNNEYPIRPVCN